MNESSTHIIGYNEIRDMLPHGEPFILVDRVLELESGKRIKCLKNITGSDPWFRGHFPHFAVMPGVLILEAIAQSALILFIKSIEKFGDKVGVLGGVKANFLKPVKPGDQLVIEVFIEKMISRGGIIHAIASVNGEKVVNANMTFGVVDKAELNM
jgi:3-hydroxyacyl-[acyl-carrier-protein] dehydratase